MRKGCVLGACEENRMQERSAPRTCSPVLGVPVFLPQEMLSFEPPWTLLLVKFFFPATDLS